MIDATTLSEVWDVHADRLMLIARSMGGPAEDAVQEAFVSLAGLEELPRDPLAWLVQVTRNRLLQWHRSNRRRQAREEKCPEPSWFESDILRVQQTLDAREVTAALQQLPSPDREVIVMHLWGEMTFDAIADVVGGSRASAHRVFQRGLNTLKAKFPSHEEAESMRLFHERN